MYKKYGRKLYGIKHAVNIINIGIKVGMEGYCRYDRLADSVTAYWLVKGDTSFRLNSTDEVVELGVFSEKITCRMLSDMIEARSK